ncbi:branched-chain amino acid ABC transporter substrate-binding protein [Salinarimonas soli]|uniref:Branched-chain amino acid ABC transporter substrate-binding protein n=1 Tax=Salinarimonas soli TaxID=1638099 RepID=A0A5B2VVI5_9HYPH|nr:branched-chain amino acid ABC transporter substrate-binding protein [Salinarimonas soli]KAA2242287.1 branched-chain amino acid ABC transporter substrate-binding protein [Salinarimonas soli]
MWTKIIAAAASVGVMTAFAAHAQTVKIAYIDPLSGPFANVGDQGLKHFEYMANKINEAGGIAGGKKVEIIGLDNKVDAKESLIQFQKAVDQGARFILQGNGSSVAAALVDAVNKHNRRNPDQRVLFLNYAAVDPVFTNDGCSYWHFRFDADADMKMEALTNWLAEQKAIKNVYIIGQDYSFGKAVAAAARSMIAKKRPDVKIVGDELHPLGKVKDFSPYVAKMRAAGTDLVITGNWGPDMSLLVKAAADANFNVPILTYYGGGLGAPTAMGSSAVDRVKQITEFHENVEGAPAALMDDFEKKTSYDLYYWRAKTLMEMLKAAADKAGSTDATAVAAALSGLEHKTELGTVTMRTDNHQLLQPLFISTLSDKVARTVEGTTLGFKTDYRIEADATRTPTTCKMERPS